MSLTIFFLESILHFFKFQEFVKILFLNFFTFLCQFSYFILHNNFLFLLWKQNSTCLFTDQLENDASCLWKICFCFSFSHSESFLFLRLFLYFICLQVELRRKTDFFFIKKKDRKKSYDWGSEMGDKRERKECIYNERGCTFLRK